MRERRRRGLSDDERALWRRVARTARPLRAGEEMPAEPEPPPEAPERPTPSTRKAGPAAEPKPQRRDPPALAPIDRRTRHRVARGLVALDDRIDLHGHDQERAHDALRAFLAAVQARGGRLVLVVTGKGLAADGHGEERGVLRRAVPKWLASARFRSLVVGFDEADRRHGGAGALYVRIRRLR